MDIRITSKFRIIIFDENQGFVSFIPQIVFLARGFPSCIDEKLCAQIRHGRASIDRRTFG